ncbi:MAG TPA: hypothetical protein ENJ44_00680, partial [Oceanospirillales bacterium]|nr:hypothetical protein [Oceanospirillales bacterium]
MGKFIPFFLLSLLCSCASSNDSQENKQNIAKAHVKKDESLVQYQHDPLPQTTKKTEILTCPWLSNVTAKNIIVKSSEPVGEIKVVDLMDENSGYNYIGCTFNRLSLKIYSEKDAKVLLERWKSFKNPSTFVAQDDIGTDALIEYPSLLNKNGLK